MQINDLLGDAYRLMKKTPKSFAPVVKPFEPLQRGHYPVFNQYPEYIVNYQRKLREKIRNEEEEYLRKKYVPAKRGLDYSCRRKITEEVQRLSEELRRDQKEWATTEWTKSDMMERWWNNVLCKTNDLEGGRRILP